MVEGGIITWGHRVVLDRRDRALDLGEAAERVGPAQRSGRAPPRRVSAVPVGYRGALGRDAARTG